MFEKSTKCEGDKQGKKTKSEDNVLSAEKRLRFSNDEETVKYQHWGVKNSLNIYHLPFLSVGRTHTHFDFFKAVEKKTKTHTCWK